MFENRPRTIAAAQAKVDFYDDLRGHPSQWTEIEYAEAEAALTAADAWDAANSVLRVAVDDALRDRLANAVHSADPGGDPEVSSQAMVAAVLAALAPGSTTPAHHSGLHA